MVKEGASHESDAWAAFEGEVLPHADRLFRLGGKSLERGGEILGGRGLVLSRRNWLRRGRFAG